MLLDTVLGNNESFLKGQAVTISLPSPVALLTCIDARLNDYLGPALGIARDEILLVRNAGNAVLDASSDPLRSLAMAIYLKGASEIVVLGHTDCRMSQFEANGFLDALAKWGVGRQQLGPVDLRRWAGAFHDPRQNVKRSVELIGQCPFIPRSMPVHGLLIDIETGKLDTVVNGYQEQAKHTIATGSAVATLPGTDAASPSAPPAITEPPKGASEPFQKIVEPAAASAAASAGRTPSPIVILPKAEPPPAPTPTPSRPIPTDLMGAVKVLRQFLWEVRNKKGYRVELDNMRARLAEEQDPVRSFQIIEETVLRISSDRPDVVAGLEIVRDHVARSPVGSYIKNLLRQILKG